VLMASIDSSIVTTRSPTSPARSTCLSQR
jgi:hypothetical protein